jgi:hypothetical protein
MNLSQAHKKSFKNEAEVRASVTCGCFYCLKVFPPASVTHWATERDGVRTAMCPFCGIDSVIGSASGIEVTHELLNALNSAYF